jgi:hypothetical protein
VYNGWLDVVAHQMHFSSLGSQKKLDFGKNLVPKYGTYAQRMEKYALPGSPRTHIVSD